MTQGSGTELASSLKLPRLKASCIAQQKAEFGTQGKIQLHMNVETGVYNVLRRFY